MPADALIPFSLFTFLTLIIVLPVYWRHRQYTAQLDVVAKALEKGIDPASIQLKLPSQEQVGDPNGNWKAGLLMLGFGLFLFLCIMLPMTSTTDFQTDEGKHVAFWAAPGLFAIPGLILLYIHYSIVGRVVKRGEQFKPVGKTGELLA